MRRYGMYASELMTDKDTLLNLGRSQYPAYTIEFR